MGSIPSRSTTSRCALDGMGPPREQAGLWYRGYRYAIGVWPNRKASGLGPEDCRCKSCHPDERVDGRLADPTAADECEQTMKSCG